MRDIKRIWAILDELEDYWEQENHPDLRLGQILVNLTRAKDLSTLFSFEDDVLLNKLKEANSEPYN